MEITPRRKLKIWWPRVAILIALAIGLMITGDLGIRYRHWAWDITAPIRFLPDIDRGYAWGRQCATEGFLNQYEKMQPQQPGDQDWLDYPPLRLGIMALWGKWSLLHFPNVKQWHDDQTYALTAPVLRFNLAMEVIGLVSAFFLTRFWANRRSSMPVSVSLRYFFRGYIPGIFAVLLLWFNPAIVLSAYGWPTWDLWVIPMFLMAALLASLNWWFTAGVILGVGAMLKGQQLIAIPVFVIWSLMMGRPLWTMRVLIGVVAAMALIASPWLLTFIPAEQLSAARAAQAAVGQVYRTPNGTFHLARHVDVPAIIWISCVLTAAAGMPWVKWLTLERQPTNSTAIWRRMLASRWAWRFFAAVGVVLLIGWPWLLQRNRGSLWMAFCATAGLVVTTLLIQPRGIILSSIAAISIALLLCMSVFHGSSAWYDCGFHYGTVHWQRLIQGGTDNLPGILAADFGWPNFHPEITAFNISAHPFGNYPAHDIAVSMRNVLLTLFGLRSSCAVWGWVRTPGGATHVC